MTNFLETSVEDLLLNGKMREALLRADIKTVGGVRNAPWQEIAALNGVGFVGFEALYKMLRNRFGLNLEGTLVTHLEFKNFQTENRKIRNRNYNKDRHKIEKELKEKEFQEFQDKLEAQAEAEADLQILEEPAPPIPNPIISVLEEAVIRDQMRLLTFNVATILNQLKDISETVSYLKRGSENNGNMLLRTMAIVKQLE